MFMDGVDEFLKSFMEKINHVLTSEGKDMNVSMGLLANFHFMLNACNCF